MLKSKFAFLLFFFLYIVNIMLKRRMGFKGKKRRRGFYFIELNALNFFLIRDKALCPHAMAIILLLKNVSIIVREGSTH